MFCRGMADDCLFLNRITSYMSEFIRSDGHEFIVERLIVPSMAHVTFSKALNRSVTGSMNDLVFQAQGHLVEGHLSPFDVSLRLNELPMSCLEYIRPKDAFLELSVQELSSLEGEVR